MLRRGGIVRATHTLKLIFDGLLTGLVSPFCSFFASSNLKPQFEFKDESAGLLNLK
jgi:hypothetical protein